MFLLMYNVGNVDHILSKMSLQRFINLMHVPLHESPCHHVCSGIKNVLDPTYLEYTLRYNFEILARYLMGCGEMVVNSGKVRFGLV